MTIACNMQASVLAGGETSLILLNSYIRQQNVLWTSPSDKRIVLTSPTKNTSLANMNNLIAIDIYMNNTY